MACLFQQKNYSCQRHVNQVKRYNLPLIDPAQFSARGQIPLANYCALTTITIPIGLT